MSNPSQWFIRHREALKLHGRLDDPGDAGTITPQGSGMVLQLISAGSETRVLSDPEVAGEMLEICFMTDGGDVAITPATAFDAAGSTTLTFTTAGSFVQFVSVAISTTAFAWRVLKSDGVAGVSPTTVYANGVQDHGTEAITATVGGGTTGLITQGTKNVTATSNGATKQISLPAATVGDVIQIHVLGAACELISAVAAHTVNDVTVGATNELALTQDAYYTCRYVETNGWIVTGQTKLGADISALVPDAL